MVTVSIRVKNKGNETAKGIELVLSQLGISEDGSIKIILVGTKIIEEIKSSEELKKDFPLWVRAPLTDGYDILLSAGVPILEGDSEPWDNSMSREFSIEREDGTISIVHKKFVHQYICIQAAKIFGENLFGEGGFEGGNYLFRGDYWRDKSEGDTVCRGAWDEDCYELVYAEPWYLPREVAIAYRHFWDADEGDNSRSLGDTSNAYQKAVYFWKGGKGEAKGIINFYNQGDKGHAYKHLGHICHLLQDMGVPAHAHLDRHVEEFPGSLLFGDDCYEDWMGEQGYDNWSYQDALNGGGLVHIPWNKIPADVSEDIFPLYYLMYTTNQYADYFASDGEDGNENDRRGWLDYSGWPGSPTKEEHLDPNPTGLLPPWDTKGNNDWGDDDDDGDLATKRMSIQCGLLPPCINFSGNQFILNSQQSIFTIPPGTIIVYHSNCTNLVRLN